MYKNLCLYPPILSVLTVITHILLTQVSDLENENTSLTEYRKSHAELEKEKERQKNELMDKIHKLEFEALEIRNNANNIDTSSMLLLL